MGVIWRMHRGRGDGSSKDRIKENRKDYCRNSRELIVF